MRIVSILPVVPRTGIRHAGGEYVLRHISALRNFADVSVVYTGSIDNHRDACLPNGPDVPSIAVERAIRADTGIYKLLQMVLKLLRGVSMSIADEAAMKSDQHVLAVLGAADIVEYQWTEQASLAPWIRKHSPAARQVLVVHDVMTQKLLRTVTHSMVVRQRIIAGLRLPFVLFAEARRFRSMDIVVTLSEKDAILVRKIAKKVPVQAIEPPLHDRDMDLPVRPLRVRDDVVLFMADFDRDENREAAIWMAESVWPLVREKVPQARLELAGSCTDTAVFDLGEKDLSITVTGYVVNLATAFRRAKVCAVPVRRGAGVKFKTIIGLLWGLPTVATTVGAEGIGDASLYIGISDESARFASLVVEGLIDWRRAAVLGQKASDWAGRRYGPCRFLQTLQCCYTEVVAAGGATHTSWQVKFEDVGHAD